MADAELGSPANGATTPPVVGATAGVVCNVAMLDTPTWSGVEAGAKESGVAASRR